MAKRNDLSRRENQTGTNIFVHTRLNDTKKNRGDILIPIIVSVISLLGTVAVYSAGSYTAKNT